MPDGDPAEDAAGYDEATYYVTFERYAMLAERAGQPMTSRVDVMRIQVQPASLHTRL